MFTGMSPADGEEITAAAIARLAGVGRAAVSNWRKRYPDFPQPAGGSPSSPTFDRADVLAWLKVTGKGDQLATAGRTDGGTLRVSAPDMDAAQIVGRGVLGIRPEASERSIADLSPRDLLARTMAALLPRSIAPDREPGEDTGQMVAASYQDLALAESELNSADVSDGSELPVVIDPACGEGLALMAVADRFGNRIRVAGQDVDERFARFAAFNLAENSRGAAYEVQAGDSFTNSQLDAYRGRAAAVVCEPPFDRPDWPARELTTDRRWAFGIPAPRDSELAWAQLSYAFLRPNGVAVVVMSQRSCVQPSGEHIRAALVRSGVLQAVIALPAGLGSTPSTEICLWMLRRPSGKPDRAPVRLIDLTGLGDPADVPLEFAAWQQLLQDDDPTVVRAVDRLELLDDGTRLLPSRYLAPRGEASAADLRQAVGRLAGMYTAVGQGLPRFSTAQGTGTARGISVTLAELERVGALTIRARDDTPRRGDVLLRTQGRMPVVATGTADDVGIAQVVEIDQERLDPHFVALFLRGDVAALPVANTLGAINRDDLRRCRIPRMPLAEQRRYGDAFRWLTDLEQALAALSDLSAKVIEQTIHSLTTGAIAPEHEPQDKATTTKSEGRDQ
jgi:N-6 DNA Methylase